MQIEDRQVFLVTGTRSQTVNVCTADNRRGRYQHVFRLPLSGVVTPADIDSRHTLAELREFLLHHGARDEGPRNADGPPTVTPHIPPATASAAPHPDDAWLARAVRTTGHAIDALVTEFVEHPYLHRVEHSLHTRLFDILVSHRIFGDSLPIGGSGLFTQPVHKEWPETVIQPGRKGRGNFDLAILSPERVAAADVKQFRAGLISPSIVIEMGLDYPLSHLQTDHDKLVNSDPPAGFLVHFVRHSRRDTATENYLLDPRRQYRIAYVHHAPNNGPCIWKALDDQALRP